MENDLLTVAEAASYLQLNEQTIRTMAREKRIPAFKVGRSWRFKKAELNPAKLNSTSNSPQLKLLVIDDDPLVHALLEASLHQYPPIIHSANNGKDGLVILAKEEIDVIFLDLSMPGMTGPETLGYIRKMKNNIPVVIVTSHPESALMEEALKQGSLTLLAKPFSPSHVVDCLAGLSVSRRY